jgi:hypothetical protein
MTTVAQPPTPAATTTPASPPTSAPAAPPSSSGSITSSFASWQQAASQPGSLSYDPNKFYVRGTDVKGHGERISGKIPPDVYGQIQQLVYSLDFPDYTMPMDFVRDAIVHHLARRQSQMGDPRLREAVESILHRLAFEEYSLKMAEDVARWDRIEENLRDALGALQRVGAWGQVWHYLEMGEELADPIPDPYRSGIMGLIREWRQRVPPEFREDA